MQVQNIIIDQDAMERGTYNQVLANAGYTEVTNVVYVGDQPESWTSYLLTLFDLIDPFGYSLEC